MLRSLQLTRFRGFQNFTLNFKPMTVIVGPNSAGKSSVIAALHSAAQLVSIAHRTNPSERRTVSSGYLRVFPIKADASELPEENVHFDFNFDSEASYTLGFQNAAKLTRVWPAERGSQFFYLRAGESGQPANKLIARGLFPMLGVIPALKPVELQETLLNDKYVRANIGGRLSSRHFRNNLFQLLGEQSVSHENKFQEYLDFTDIWLPEYKLSSPTLSGEFVDCYYREDRKNRELAWAGDGIQVFYQLLYHIFRLKGASTIILDEPEVFLHADLQRRLLSVLAGLETQIIIATHSSEIITECPPDSVVWVERSKRRAISAPKDAELENLAKAIGTGFNLRLAPLLRTRIALFVEGGDLQVLKPIAKNLGFTSLETESGVAVVPMEGSSNYQRLISFDWIAATFLKGGVKGVAVFDRDFGSDEWHTRRQQSVQTSGIRNHTWSKHELENYLIVPSLIARLSKIVESEVIGALVTITRDMRNDVMKQMIGQRTSELRSTGIDASTVFQQCNTEVTSWWDDNDARINLCPGKEILAGLNSWLQERGAKALSVRQLAQKIEPREVDEELFQLLRYVESEARGVPISSILDLKHFQPNSTS